jgi:hypothetical protein
VRGAWSPESVRHTTRSCLPAPASEDARTAP